MSAPLRGVEEQILETADVPLSIEPGRLRSLLVVAPHPDDEVIGAGGLLKAVRDSSRPMQVPVRVVVVSDGAASHPGSGVPPRELAAMRRAESRAAMAHLGVEDVRFCGFADGQGPRWQDDADARARFRGAVSGQWGAVCLPGAADAHPDHVAARALARRHVRADLWLGYTVWPKGEAPAPEAEYRLTAGERAAKREALRLYRSQMGAIADDPGGFTIDADLFKRFTGAVEAFSLS